MVAVKSTPEDKNPGNPLKPALLVGAAPKTPSPAVVVSIHGQHACFSSQFSRVFFLKKSFLPLVSLRSVE